MAKGVGGRPRKPTELKVLEGNPGKRPIPINEIKPVPKSIKCPEWLDEYAKAVWNEYGPKLEKLGLFTEIDGLDFINLCIAAGDVRLHTETLTRSGHILISPQGFEMQRPEVSMRNSAIKIITTISGKFGLSPSDRAGLVSTKDEDKGNKMSKLLGG
jgi:P27 family predicted phage terminase small subunit